MLEVLLVPLGRCAFEYRKRRDHGDDSAPKWLKQLFPVTSRKAGRKALGQEEEAALFLVVLLSALLTCILRWIGSVGQWAKRIIMQQPFSRLTEWTPFSSFLRDKFCLVH